MSEQSTKRCPFCAEEIQAAAIVCRFCNRSLAQQSAQPSGLHLKCVDCGHVALRGPNACPNCGHVYFTEAGAKKKRTTTSKFLWFIAAAMGLSIVGSVGVAFFKALSDPRFAGPTYDPTVPAEPRAQVELLSWHWSREHGFIKAEGEVRNLTNQPITRLWAVVTFYTTNETLVTSDESVVEFDPLMPQQTSPFDVMVRDNPQISGATVRFRTARAGELSVKRPPNKNK